jgi:hypothetical protein
MDQTEVIPKRQRATTRANLIPDNAMKLTKEHHTSSTSTGSYSVCVQATLPDGCMRDVTYTSPVKAHVLGQGSFGSVRLVQAKLSTEGTTPVAIKTVLLDQQFVVSKVKG